MRIEENKAEDFNENNPDFDVEMTPGGLRLIHCHLTDREIILPEEINGEKLRIIGSRAFTEDAQFTEKITIPGTVRIVEEYAFELCLSLEEVILNEGVEVLGREFLISTRVEKIRIPSSVRKIEDAGLLSAGVIADENNPVYLSDDYGLYSRRKDGTLVLETVNPKDKRVFYSIRQGTAAIREGAFEEHVNLESLEIPASLVNLPDKVLVNSANPYSKKSGIKTVLIDETNPHFFEKDGSVYENIAEHAQKLVRYLGNAFDYRPEENVSSIGPYAFIHSVLRHIDIPSTVLDLNSEAFIGCHVREIFFEGEKLRIRFPKNHEHRLYGLLKAFGQNGKIYDFDYYDHFLIENTEPMDGDRLRMICCRLENDRDMSGETRKRIIAKVQREFKTLIEVAGRENDIESLEKMAALHFFTEDNIEDAIDALSRFGRKEAMAVLMDFKHQNFKEEDFDFSL